MRSGISDANRRLNPRITDPDWLPMSGLSRAVARFAAARPGQGLTALDVGCGSQPYRPLFEAAGFRYLAADMGSGTEISISETGIVGAPDASADLIVSFQVLEHVRDLETYLSEARRLLKPGGTLLLSTHGVWFYHPHPEDHRRWTRTGLIHEIEARGFRVVNDEALVGPLAWTTVFRLLGYCYVLRRIPVLGGIVEYGLAAMMNLRAAIEDRLTPRQITRDNACIYLVQAVPEGHSSR
jgi:SAM-dependent methyltransferase